MREIILRLKELESMDGEYYELIEKSKQLPETLKTMEKENIAIRNELLNKEEELKKTIAREDLFTREIDEITAKVKALDKKMFTLRRLEEVDALEKEKEFLIKTRKEKEREVLDIMDLRENLEKIIPELRSKVEKSNNEFTLSRDKTTAEIQNVHKRLKTLEERRESIKKAIPLDIYQKYERIYKAREGKAIAYVDKEGVCSECGIQLRPQIIAMTKLNKKIVECEGCSRILYFQSNKNES
ncbi:MAG: C4-type zinc ribbon domain-containing protein [Candidatus Hydrogenedentota bacterium]